MAYLDLNMLSIQKPVKLLIIFEEATWLRKVKWKNHSLWHYYPNIEVGKVLLS